MLFLGALLAATDFQHIIGTVSPPPGVDKFNSNPGAVNNIGIVVFVSNMIKVATVIAGVWVLFNFIAAGYTYITESGNANAATKVKDQITMSVQGLVIIVAAYTIIAVISFLLFGDAGFILNPTLPTPQ